MAVRRKIAFVTILLISIGFVALFRYVWRLFTPKEEPTSGSRKGLRKYALAYLLLAPAVLTIFVFNYYPLARGAIMAFQDYRLLGESTPRTFCRRHCLPRRNGFTITSPLVRSPFSSGYVAWLSSG